MKNLSICCMVMLLIVACGGEDASNVVATWPNGQPREIRVYEPEKPGEMPAYHQQLFFANGQLQAEGDRVDTLKNGKWQEWYEDGTRMREGLYVLGKKEGLHLTYYPNGKNKERVKYALDVPDGPYKLFDERGKVLSAGEFAEGRKVGQWSQAADPLAGTPATETNFYEDGTPESIQEYISLKDEHYTWRYWNPQGKLIEQGTYFSGEKDGNWETFYNNGSPKSKGRYEVGLQAGVWQFWYPNGQKQRDVRIDRREEQLVNYWYSNGEQAVEQGKGRLIDTLKGVRRVRVFRDSVEVRSREKEL